MKKDQRQIDQNKVEKLRFIMSAISEHCWAAGWMDGTEYALWDLMQAGGGDTGRWDLMPEEAEILKELSNAIGGWLWWPSMPDGKLAPNGPLYISIEEWLKHLEEKGNR